MNYTSINKGIIQAKDPALSEHKKKDFYRYLLDNNTAYYYSTVICKQKGMYEKDIIQAGDTLNERYINTLKIIRKICKEARIEFLLFKTHKHIPEVVDGDIDLFIKEKDFLLFLDMLKKKGFVCHQDGKLKASCEKPGFCIIEPRVHISFQGEIFLREQDIWKHVRKTFINKILIKTTTKELDMFFILLNILYGPNYFKLYSYFIFKTLDLKKIYSLGKNNRILHDLKLVIGTILSSSTVHKKFPLFPADSIFLQWWKERILPNSNISLYIKIRHILFFVFAKYGYKTCNNLPLRHDWKLTYV